MVDVYKELRDQVEEIEKKGNDNEGKIGEILKVIRFLVKEDEKPRKRIGFAVEK